MNRALVFLLGALFKRRAWHFARSLRRPTRLLGVVAVLGAIGVLFHFRHEEIFGQLLKREAVMAYALLMVFASLFKGFLQRGLVFEPPDIEFVFTSPFSQRQVLFYRLLPNYLYAVVQALFCAALLAPHLQHPVLFTVGLALFQAMCFHVATAAAVFSGTIPEDRHHRLRWLMVAGFFLLAAIYLRVECDVHLVPAWAALPLAQLAFYPAVTVLEAAREPALNRWAWNLARTGSVSVAQYWRPLLQLGLVAAGAGASLWALLRLKANLFEAALATTSRVAERRLRLRQGRDLVPTGQTRAGSARLPSLPCFRGVGAILWKNLLVARRSRRKMLWAVVFTAVYTWLLAAVIHKIYSEPIPPEAREMAGRVWGAFNLAVAGFVAMLGFFLQRMFPFDFRRDGLHLAGFRTLPMSPLAVVLAELAVPVALVLVCQAIGLVPLLIYGRYGWPTLVLIVLGFPAVAVALNSIWNLYHVIGATTCAGGQERSPSAVGTLLVVWASFLVFVPALWLAKVLAAKTSLLRGADADPTTVDGLGALGVAFQTHLPLAAGGWLLAQYLVDVVLILLMARLFHRFEVARDS